MMYVLNIISLILVFVCIVRYIKTNQAVYFGALGISLLAFSFSLLYILMVMP